VFFHRQRPAESTRGGIVRAARATRFVSVNAACGRTEPGRESTAGIAFPSTASRCRSGWARLPGGGAPSGVVSPLRAQRRVGPTMDISPWRARGPLTMRRLRMSTRGHAAAAGLQGSAARDRPGLVGADAVRVGLGRRVRESSSVHARSRSDQGRTRAAAMLAREGRPVDSKIRVLFRERFRPMVHDFERVYRRVLGHEW